MLVGGHGLGDFRCLGNRMACFQRRKDAFVASQEVESAEGFVVAARGVLDAFGIFPVAVFWTDAWVVQACRH